MKWNRNEIKDSNIIQCKIIANSNISNIKPSTRLTSMIRKLHDIGRKTWQDAVVSWRDFRHSWITKMSNVILKPSPFNMKPSANDRLHDQYKVVQPVVTDRNISYYQSWICSTNGTTSRATCQPTIMRDCWYDPARLVARSCTTCLRSFVICNRGSRVLNMTIDLAATKFARTITHDF